VRGEAEVRDDVVDLRGEFGAGTARHRHVGDGARPEDDRLAVGQGVAGLDLEGVPDRVAQVQGAPFTGLERVAVHDADLQQCGALHHGVARGEVGLRAGLERGPP